MDFLSRVARLRRVQLAAAGLMSFVLAAVFVLLGGVAFSQTPPEPRLPAELPSTFTSAPTPVAGIRPEPPKVDESAVPSSEGLTSFLLTQTASILSQMKVASGDFSSCPLPCELDRDLGRVIEGTARVCNKTPPDDVRESVAYDGQKHDNLFRAYEATCSRVSSAQSQLGQGADSHAWRDVVKEVIRQIEPIVSAEIARLED